MAFLLKKLVPGDLVLVKFVFADEKGVKQRPGLIVSTDRYHRGRRETILAAITITIYIFAYTPLKRASTANTVVGAIPGAIPPVIGWAAARGTIDSGAWSLFAILLLWQLPHFFAIAWMYREDYSRAGFRMISSDDLTGERSASQSVFFCILLLIMGGLPAFVGIVSFAYLAIELVLGGLFIAVAMRFLRLRTREAARLLFITSIVYLPLLLAALVLTKS